MWTDSGWRFSSPTEGLTVWDRTDGFARRWDGSAWTSGQLDCSALRVGGEQVVGAQVPSPPNPSGGTIIDAEARSAIDGLIAALMSHGLIV
jgi:hypothetical protein